MNRFLFSQTIAFALLLCTHNVVFSQVPDKQDRLASAGEPTVIQVYALKNFAASAAATIIRDLLSDDSPTLTADVETNVLLARGTSGQLQQLERLLEELDSRSAEPPKEQASEGELRAYVLRYSQAETALNVVSTVLSGISDVRLSADRRLNRLIVFAPKEGHELVARALTQIDVSGETSGQEKTHVLEFSDFPLSLPGKAQLVQGTARKHEVNVDVVQELGVAVVKGRSTAVEEFLADLENVRMQLQSKSANTARVAQEDSYSIRVLWLAAAKEPQALSSSDPLHAVKARAASFGIDNLVQVGQLIAASRTQQDQPASFTVGGMAEVDDKLFNLSAEGTLASIDSERTAFAMRLSILVSSEGGRGEYSNRQAAVEVDMQLGANKPVIFAAAPIDGSQSIFVVEIVPVG